MDPFLDLALLGVVPDSVAGPVFGDTAELTNLGWTVDASRLAATFRIARVSLINDFYAIALGMPFLAESDLLSLNRGARERTATCPFSFSRSPTTSRYGTRCSVCSRIL